MTKLELTSSWPTVVRMAGEGASLREIAEEVNATPGAINVALKRMGIEKAPAPPGPRARRSAAPPPPKQPKAPKVAKEIKTRQKAAKAPKAKTFPEVLAGVFEEFGIACDPLNIDTPTNVETVLRSLFRSLGLTPKDNLSDADDCDENVESVQAPSVQVDADVNSEDDNGDCDGEANTDDVEDDDPAFAMTDDFMGPVPSGNGPEWGEEIVELADCSSVQTPDADPNEQTLRGEVIDDWGTPPGFTIPDDETLSTMNRDDLRKLAANPACRDAFCLKGYSKMKPEDLRKALAKVRNES